MKIVLGILIAVGLVGGGYFASQYVAPKRVSQEGELPVQGNSTITKIETVKEKQATNTIKANIDAQANFEKKFADCQSSSFVYSYDFVPGSEVGEAQYKIFGPVAGGCKMSMKYTQRPSVMDDQSWVNKELVCAFDNKISFQAAIEKAVVGIVNGSVVCEGPLFGLIKSTQL